MKPTRIAAILWLVAGLVFLFLAVGSEPQNNTYLALGVVFVILGSALLQRARGA